MVGVVHDTDGYPVAAATVILHAPGGSRIAGGTTAVDGTFAVAAGRAVAAVEIRCAYCLQMTVGYAGRPVLAVVRRFAALRDRGISADDARVLPYAAVTDLAALLPFAVTTYGTISDRGLAGVQGSVVADGIGLYRASDGIDLGTAIPAHGTATIVETAPTAANAYGAYSSGGLFSIDTLDQSGGLVRVDGSTATDVAIRGGSALRGAFETAGGSDAATRGVVAGTLATAAGNLDVRAVSAGGLGADASGFATTLATPVRTAMLTTSLSMSRSDDEYGAENDSLATLALQSGGITYGVRAQRASSFSYAPAAESDTRAFVQSLQTIGSAQLFVSLAAAASSETLRERSSQNGAVLPVVSVSTHVAPMFTLHADSVAALLTTPLYLTYAVPNGTAVDRSHLSDAGLGFDDGNRFRIDVMAFRETVSETAYGTTAGSGVSLVWQVAPSLAIRSWTLVSHNGAGYIDQFYSAGTTNLDRSVTWLTAGNVLRVDAIWRGSELAGDVSMPVMQHVRFVAGTRRAGASRVVTAGISWP